MIIKAKFHPAHGDGIDTAVTEIYEDLTMDEFDHMPDEVRAAQYQYLEKKLEISVASVVDKIMRYGRWLGEDPQAALDRIDTLRYPWMEISQGREVLGYSAADFMEAYKQAGLTTVEHMAAVIGKKVEFDFRDRQISFFASIGRKDLILGARNDGVINRPIGSLRFN